jgi:hypothetical protein
METAAVVIPSQGSAFKASPSSAFMQWQAWLKKVNMDQMFPHVEQVFSKK